MVDVLRAYNRWLRRRLWLLGPSFAAAVAVILRLALDHGTSSWLKIGSLSLALIIVALLGFLLVETILCARLQRGAGREYGRVLRRQLANTRGLAVVSLLLLGVIALVPDYFPGPASTVRPRREPRADPWNVSLAAADRFEQVPPDRLPVAPEASTVPPPMPAPAPEPRALPFLESLPLHLDLTHAEFEIPPPTELPLSLQETALAEAPQERESRQPRFRPDELDLLSMDRGRAPKPGLFRLGTREENDLEGMPPLELRFEGMLLSGEGIRRGWGGVFTADLPIGQDSSLRAVYAIHFLPEKEDPGEQAPQQVWHRFTVDYVYRILGYTRHAPFDLAVSAGLAVDRFSLPERQDAVSEKARISPVLGLDLALWQESSMGLLLHASQSAPLNLTGASSAVTEASAVIRWDLTERMSMRIGYRLYWVRLRGYSEALDREGETDELDATLSGPLVGMEFRF